MGMEGEDQPAFPAGRHAPAQFQDLAHRGVAIFQGKRKISGQGGDGLILGQVRRRQPPVNQQLGARADGGNDGLHQHLAKSRAGQGFAFKRHLPGAGEIKGLSFHLAVPVRFPAQHQVIAQLLVAEVLEARKAPLG